MQRADSEQIGEVAAMRVITFDIEIAIPINELDDGWESARRGEAGVSSVVLYDSETERYHVYDANTIDECMDHLNSADLLVGFNCDGFDIPALEGYTGTPITPPSYDILKECWRALGVHNKHKGWGLAQQSQRCFGLGKSGSGESAPLLFREGRYAELIDYNIHDVYLTRRLANYAYENGYVLGLDDEPFPIPPPPCAV